MVRVHIRNSLQLKNTLADGISQVDLLSVGKIRRFVTASTTSSKEDGKIMTRTILQIESLRKTPSMAVRIR
jgi:hypothetical protein